MNFPEPRAALLDLLNLPKVSRQAAFYGSDKTSPSDVFISRYGPLRFSPELGTWFAKYTNINQNPGDPHVALRQFAGAFSAALSVSERGADGQVFINGVLSIIFGSAQIDGTNQPPALKVDILAGTIKPAPRDLLDAIAVEFMHAYKKIGRCERCQRYFFKDYVNDRYCSPPCAQKSRSEAQREWMRNYRAGLKRKQESKRSKRRIV